MFGQRSLKMCTVQDFDEPTIIVDGIQYNGSEDYYHSQNHFLLILDMAQSKR